MKGALLLLALGGAAYFYPIRHERAADACQALARRTAALEAAVPGAPPRPVPGDAAAAAARRFPLLPPALGCTALYWGSMMDSDMVRAARQVAFR